MERFEKRVFLSNVDPFDFRILWPPALKLFYRFLHEKGYLNNPDKIIGRIDKIESYFIEAMRQMRFN
jgi:hypothetical protein